MIFFNQKNKLKFSASKLLYVKNNNLFKFEFDFLYYFFGLKYIYLTH